jgi:hypothetical protein
MTQIRQILDALRDTDLMLERWNSLVQENPNDKIAQFNVQGVEKRRRDLERRLNYELNVQQAALPLKGEIEATSDEKIEKFVYECELVGIDDEQSYFHIKNTDKSQIIGSIAKGFAKGHYVTHEMYRAEVTRSITGILATGEDKERWTLHKLTRI